MKREDMKVSKSSVELFCERTDIDIMGYKSPIQIIMGQMRTELENGIFRAVQEQGVIVDKDELIKALQYDRGQYEKGYNAGRKQVAVEIFAAIENLFFNQYLLGNITASLFEERFAELKNKYTESEGAE